MKRTLLHPLFLWPLAGWALARLLVIPWMEAALFDPARVPGWEAFVSAAHELERACAASTLAISRWM